MKSYDDVCKEASTDAENRLIDHFVRKAILVCVYKFSAVDVMNGGQIEYVRWRRLDHWHRLRGVSSSARGQDGAQSESIRLLVAD